MIIYSTYFKAIIITITTCYVLLPATEDTKLTFITHYYTIV